jgi:hypothetical protein
MTLLTLISGSGLLDGQLPSADIAILFGVKTMLIIFGVLYFLFALLVTRQISIMSNTITTTASPKIKTLGFVHLVISIVVLIYFFIVL